MSTKNVIEFGEFVLRIIKVGSISELVTIVSQRMKRGFTGHSVEIVVTPLNRGKTCRSVIILWRNLVE